MACHPIQLHRRRLECEGVCWVNSSGGHLISVNTINIVDALFGRFKGQQIYASSDAGVSNITDLANRSLEGNPWGNQFIKKQNAKKCRGNSCQNIPILSNAGEMVAKKYRSQKSRRIVGLHHKLWREKPYLYAPLLNFHVC